jgi:peptidyl-prolyl cis-trans isomerase SurA
VYSTFSLSLAVNVNKVMFTLTANDNEKVEYTQQDFAQYIAKHQHPHKSKGSLTQEINNLYKNFVEEKVLAFEDSRLEKKYPEFRLLMKEYEDGILLFDLTDKKVWSKAVKDTAGLRKFYMEHRENYKWPERVDATLYKCKDEKTAKTLLKMLKKAAKKNWSEEDVLNKLNENSKLNVSSEQDIYAKGDNAVIDNSEWKENNIQIIKTDDEQVYVVKINKVLPQSYKTIDEARGIITSDYQNYLEEEWVKELKEKYPVKIHEEVFKSIIKQ